MPRKVPSHVFMTTVVPIRVLACWSLVSTSPARICDRAEPGQVLVSRVVADLCAGKQLSFRPAGGARMKGFDEPAAAFEVPG